MAEELQSTAFEVLVREMGPADAIRFWQSIKPGQGDYVKERYRLLGDEDVDTIARRIMKRQAEQLRDG